MSAITTHVLDISRGRPASGIPVRLELESGDGTWHQIGDGLTDMDGRARSLLAADSPLQSGVYRLVFDTESYFVAQAVEGFYREVAIMFEVRDATQHYHVPLLLSPFGYSTYRGS